jgi:hypothetical protein
LGWERAPIERASVGSHDGAVRIVVLWNRCRGVSADEDERWVREETAKLAACNGVARVAVQQVESAALRHPRAFDWCLELELADQEPPNAVVRRAPCSEFLADLRLLGTRPTVFVLPGAAS